MKVSRGANKGPEEPQQKEQLEVPWHVQLL